MKITCENPECGKEFEAERASARFCSGACKMKHVRSLRKPEQAEIKSEPSDEEIKAMDKEDQDYRDKVMDEIQNLPVSTKKPLLTGRASPGLAYPEWSRPKYWLRLRDLPEDEQGPFHAFLKGRNNPTDPTLPTEEQDFYHPWAYSEWKNPEEKVATEPYPTGPLVPMTIPKGETPEQIKVRLGRIRDYNSTMEPRHHLSESKLRAILRKGGYSPDLAKHVFSKTKPSTEIPE